jgi:hypothetical protein
MKTSFLKFFLVVHIHSLGSKSSFKFLGMENFYGKKSIRNTSVPLRVFFLKFFFEKLQFCEFNGDIQVE